MVDLSLDTLDRKLLLELDANSRQSFSRIGKRLKVSKEVVNYRVKNLEKEKVITRFFTEINLARLGMQVYKIYLQFQNVTGSKEAEMYKYFTEELAIPWVVSCSGKYDMIISFGARDINHFDEYLSKIMNKFSEYILNREVSTTLFFSTYSRSWLVSSVESHHTTVGGEISLAKLDDKDYKILAALSDDSRAGLAELGLELRLTSGAVAARIGSLQKQGVINAYRIGVNYKALGREFCKTFVYLKNRTSDREKKLIAYVEQLPQTFTIIKCVGSWDMEFEFIVNNVSEFYGIMKDLRNRFDFVKSYESVVVSEEYGINYFRFISKNEG